MQLAAHRAWRQMIGVLGLLTTLLATPSSHVQAQSARGWQADALLAPHLIRTMATDSSGVLWVGTEAGVFRYDGHTLVPINAVRRRGVRLPSGPCYGLLIDARGQLWVSNSAGVFLLTTTGELRLLARPVPGAPHRVISGLAADPTGRRIWVAQYLAGARAYDLSGRPFGPTLQWPGEHIINLIGTVDGSLWVTQTDSETRRFAPDGRLLGRWAHPGQLLQLVARPSGEPLLVSGRAAFRLLPNGTLAEVLRWLPPGEENTASAVVHDTTLVVLFKEQLYHASVGRRFQLLGEQRVPVAALTHISIDGAGTWWCHGTRQRGAFRGGPSGAFVHLLTPPDGGAASTRAVARARDGRLIVSSYRRMMEQPAGQPHAPLQEWAYLQEHNRPLLHVFYALVATQPASDTLLGALETGQFAALHTGTHAVRSVAVEGQADPPQANCLARAPRTGRLWGGSGTGLYWYDEGHHFFRAYTHPRDPTVQPLRGIPTEDISLDETGRLWLAGLAGLHALVPETGAVATYSATQPGAHRLPTDECLCTWPDPQTGHIWVGTRTHGLLELDPALGVLRVVGPAEGLPHVAVGGLLPGPDRSLWISTYYGLARLDLATGRLAVFSAADGLSDPPELNRHAQLADVDGSLLFGGVGGLHRIDPRRAPETGLAPRLLLMAVRTTLDSGRVRYLLPAATRAPALRQASGEAPPELWVALTDFREPAQRRYSWRLTGANEPGRWLSVGASGRVVVPVGLAPGAYTVEVRAATGRGLAARNRLRVPLTVAPAWWQRRWVQTLGVLLLGGLLYGIHRARLRGALREERLRTRLAADLHDEVGSLLARVTMQAELLHELAPAPSTALTELAEDSRLAATTMRDIVWSIDARADTLAALLDRMHDHLDATARLAGWPTVVFTLDPNLDPAAPLRQVVRQHLYLIFKEAVTNVVRHGHGATAVRVALGPDGRGGLWLVVENDGLPVETRGLSGLGLRNMTQRAALLGVELAVGPRVGGGWRVAVGRG